MQGRFIWNCLAHCLPCTFFRVAPRPSKLNSSWLWPGLDWYALFNGKVSDSEMKDEVRGYVHLARAAFAGEKRTKAVQLQISLLLKSRWVQMFLVWVTITALACADVVNFVSLGVSTYTG